MSEEPGRYAIELSDGRTILVWVDGKTVHMEVRPHEWTAALAVDEAVVLREALHACIKIALPPA